MTVYLMNQNKQICKEFKNITLEDALDMTPEAKFYFVVSDKLEFGFYEEMNNSPIKGVWKKSSSLDNAYNKISI